MRILFTILKDLGYPVGQEVQDYYNKIQFWNDWWKGYVQEFHKYQIKNESGNSRDVKRKQMRMAKKVCEDWADLLLNDKTRILVECDDHGTDVTQEFLTGDKEDQNGGVLGNSKFWKLGNKAVEREFAQGTVCFYLQLVNPTVNKGQLSAQNVQIKAIKDAQKIVPLTYDEEDISEIALASEYTQNGERFMYIQVFKQEQEGYQIYNHYFKINSVSGDAVGYERVSAPHGEAISYKLPCKPFVILKPNIENNIADVPLGMSIYANAIDMLESCDLAYDNLFMDTLLGKKKVFMDQALFSMKPTAYALNDKGERVPVKQEPDVGATLEKSLYVTTGTQVSPDKPRLFEEYNPSLRVDENKENVQFNLNLLSSKCGLGQNRYQFSIQNMTTATQVRASNKELTESVWKQRIAIQDALTELTRSIIILGKEKCHISGLDPDVRITIQFDDTMFSDEEAERLRMLQEISAGILQKWEYRVRYYGEDEETAREMTGETENPADRIQSTFFPQEGTQIEEGPEGEA